MTIIMKETEEQQNARNLHFWSKKTHAKVFFFSFLVRQVNTPAMKK